MRPAIVLLVAAGLVACGSDPGGSGDDDASGDGGPGDGGSYGEYPGTGDDLDTALGCAGVYNPDQLLDFHLTMAPADWQMIQNDCTFTLYAPAELRCEDGPPIRVGVRHKRSGGTSKPGLKIDINEYVDGQELFSLRKLSWENGVGSSATGCGEDGTSTEAMLTEYLAWRLHVRSGEMTSRAAFVNVTMNGAPLGAFLSVEVVDKPFVKRRLGDASGWIWKFSGSPGDGQQTNEGVDDPYDDYFCFFERSGCAPPPSAQLATELPTKLDIPQLLSVGAVNAIMANTDAILLKQNNYVFYDWAGPRAYFPWDLDTTMNGGYDVFTGTVPGGTTAFTDVLFTHWEDDYDALLTQLLAGPLSLDAITMELDRAVRVAGPALELDPFVGGSAGAARDAILDWWTARHADVSAQVAAH
ncbi:MAG: CotH kinase family protein [Deltaproteobacteria bacterium]|nr:CotH kinase family protein [Kofleriaceae bacterium]